LAPPRRRSPRARPRRDAVAAAGRWLPPRARHHRSDPARGLPDRVLPALRLRPERARPADRTRPRRRPQIAGTVVTSVLLTVTSVLLTVLGGVACLALMGAAIWLLPRPARRSRLLRRVAARPRGRTPIERIVPWVEAEHPGEAFHRQGAFFGRGVVLAARIAAHAQGGDILISALVRDLVAERGDIELRDAGQAEFKGLDGRHRLFEVAWTPASTLTLTDDAPAAPPTRDT